MTAVEDNIGYNARTDNMENLVEAGIIDPKKVSRVALENAASAAGMIILTECTMVDIPEENASAPQGMPMM
jgi:chaperonin GroEL